MSGSWSRPGLVLAAVATSGRSASRRSPKTKSWVSKGENISAKEVEDVLYGHPDVREVAVIGVPDPETGERCCAVVVPESEAAPELEALVAFCRDAGLAAQKWPERLELLDPGLGALTLGAGADELRRRFDALARAGATELVYSPAGPDVPAELRAMAEVFHGR